MARTKDFYLLLLAYALVEIRSFQAEGGNLDLAPKLADIFHNLPEALRLPWTGERDGRIYAQMKEKARLHGLADLLDRWERRAFRRLDEEAREQGGACPPQP
jgi:hypothetical protein